MVVSMVLSSRDLATKKAKKKDHFRIFSGNIGISDEVDYVSLISSKTRPTWAKTIQKA